MKEGSINLRKFRTNSRTLQTRKEKLEGQNEASHGVHVREKSSNFVVPEPVSSISEETKVLGMHWNPTQDVFILNPSVSMPAYMCLT